MFFWESNICLSCKRYLTFHHWRTGNFTLIAESWNHYQLMLWFIDFFLNQPIGMCYSVILWIDCYQIQEFPSVHGHNCWSVPTILSPLSLKTVIQRHTWASMRWHRSFQCWWLIAGNYCGFQQHLGIYSCYKQFLDTWTAPSSRWRAILSHLYFSPRCHMLS